MDILSSAFENPYFRSGQNPPFPRDRPLKILTVFPTIVKNAMKRYIVSIALCLSCLAAHAAGIEAVTYARLVAEIQRVSAPAVSGRYVVFTASGAARHVGVAFEHEGYRSIHSFQRLVKRDVNGLPQKDERGIPLETVLFFVAEVPPRTAELRYRMVIDGLWTTDPANPAKAYEYAEGMEVSVVAVDPYDVFETQATSPSGVRFTYEGRPGSIIRLAGNFNNWDPFMYELTEVSPGKYELVLPLPAGTWYYAYFEGTAQLADSGNHDRVYTPDGRVASVVRVP